MTQATRSAQYQRGGLSAIGVMLAMCLALLGGPAAFAGETPDKAAPADQEAIVFEVTGFVATGVVAFVEAEAVDDGDTFPWGRTALWAATLGSIIGLVYLLKRTSKRMDLSWRAAYGWGFVIFLYFVLTTTWFPSWLLAQQTVANAPGWVSDLVGSGAWFVPLVIGLVALRWLQKTERI